MTKRESSLDRERVAFFGKNKRRVSYQTRNGLWWIDVVLRSFRDGKVKMTSGDVWRRYDNPLWNESSQRRVAHFSCGKSDHVDDLVFTNQDKLPAYIIKLTRELIEYFHEIHPDHGL